MMTWPVPRVFLGTGYVPSGTNVARWVGGFVSPAVCCQNLDLLESPVRRILLACLGFTLTMSCRERLMG